MDKVRTYRMRGVIMETFSLLGDALWNVGEDGDQHPPDSMHYLHQREKHQVIRNSPSSVFLHQRKEVKSELFRNRGPCFRVFGLHSSRVTVL